MIITIFKLLRRIWRTVGARSSYVALYELKLCCLVHHHGPVPSTVPGFYIVRERGTSKTSEVLGSIYTCQECNF